MFIGKVMFICFYFNFLVIILLVGVYYINGIRQVKKVTDLLYKR